MKPFWSAFFARLMSPATARFVLALMALGFSAYGANILIGREGDDAGQAATFAVGQLFALATLAFGYYFGSTARGDEKPIETEIVNPPDRPAQVEDVDSPEGEDQ
ncbi:hypothetical protein [Qipengyuania sp. MTN3-11]|uniref:hypothetical protein n=1 Tax=Qipengyuania sp. MTN3-11 TaxID=3056557 RepID=UPI0036F2DC69